MHSINVYFYPKLFNNMSFSSNLYYLYLSYYYDFFFNYSFSIFAFYSPDIFGFEYIDELHIFNSFILFIGVKDIKHAKSAPSSHFFVKYLIECYAFNCV